LQQIRNIGNKNPEGNPREDDPAATSPDRLVYGDENFPTL